MPQYYIKQSGWLNYVQPTAYFIQQTIKFVTFCQCRLFAKTIADPV